MENNKLNLMREMEGEEVWTNAFGDRFGERVCVGIEKGECINAGKRFKPTKKEIQELWNDIIRNEFGSEEQQRRDLEAEFTPEYCKELLKN